jgi:Protein of unknown function (DUF433)
MLEWSHCPAVERGAGKVSGASVFKGTRVPVRALFENFEDGVTVDDFLEWFPGSKPSSHTPGRASSRHRPPRPRESQEPKP